MTESFSAQVFKTQTGMNPAHRDRLAFARIHSGVFHRGMTVRDDKSGRPMVLKHVQTVFGADRSTVDVAWPGDVIGLVNARHVNVGDTLSENGRIAYPVHEITIAGNLREMFKGIAAIGADAYTMGTKTIGSVLLDRMKIAGS